MHPLPAFFEINVPFSFVTALGGINIYETPVGAHDNSEHMEEVAPEVKSLRKRRCAFVRTRVPAGEEAFLSPRIRAAASVPMTHLSLTCASQAVYQVHGEDFDGASLHPKSPFCPK